MGIISNRETNLRVWQGKVVLVSVYKAIHGALDILLGHWDRYTILDERLGVQRKLSYKLKTNG